MKINFTFFGSSLFSIYALDELFRLGFVPYCIVTTPDKPQGRKLTITPNVVKSWAIEHKIKVYDPEKIDAKFIKKLEGEISDSNIASNHLFVVASFGKILPKDLIDMPVRGTLNIHPSLLPQYRGASPLQTAILNDTKKTGITIIRIDEQMDHGPIVAQKIIDIAKNIGEWPTYEVFEQTMAEEGARLLASILPDWASGKIKEVAQDHQSASYTKKISKDDGLIDILDDPYTNFRKTQAYHLWPQTYFLIDKDGKKLKVKITVASFSGGELKIEKVIPEGSKEMTYTDFVNGYAKK